MLCLSPPKLNLFLHIVGRRDDGYHELQTVFQFLDYCDELEFTRNWGGIIYREDSASKYAEDLIIGAANLLKAEAIKAGIPDTELGVKISLNKKIPEGGGLGGGSSNAATTLVALNKLWNLGFDRARLVRMGLRLGADVPIFVEGFSAWAEGVGEKLMPYEPPEVWFLVANPQIKVNTKEIFNAKHLTRNTPRMKMSALSDKETGNDCTCVVLEKCPEIAELMDWLSYFGRPALTGTGACVFVIFGSHDEAKDVLAKLPDKWSGFVAQGKNTSPLYGNIN